MFRASALVTKIGLLLFNQQFHQSKYQGADIEFPTKRGERFSWRDKIFLSPSNLKKKILLLLMNL